MNTIGITLKVFCLFIITTIIFSACSVPKIVSSSKSNVSKQEKFVSSMALSDKHMLIDDIDFTVDDIEYIEENHVSNYYEDEVTVNIKNISDIERYIDNFNNIVVKKLVNGERPAEIGIGGGEYTDTIYLKDKTKYVINDFGRGIFVTTRDNEDIKYECTEYNNHFRLLYNDDRLPEFAVQINEKDIIVKNITMYGMATLKPINLVTHLKGIMKTIET